MKKFKENVIHGLFLFNGFFVVIVLIGIFALLMLILVPTLAYFKIGGWGPATQAIAQSGVSLSIFPESASLWTIISLILVWGPGYFGQPQLLSFFMGIKNPKRIRYAKIIAFIWAIIALLFSASIGLIGLAYFKHGGETIFIQLTVILMRSISGSMSVKRDIQSHIF